MDPPRASRRPNQNAPQHRRSRGTQGAPRGRRPPLSPSVRLDRDHPARAAPPAASHTARGGSPPGRPEARPPRSPAPLGRCGSPPTRPRLASWASRTESGPSRWEAVQARRHARADRRRCHRPGRSRRHAKRRPALAATRTPARTAARRPGCRARHAKGRRRAPGSTRVAARKRVARRSRRTRSSPRRNRRVRGRTRCLVGPWIDPIGCVCPCHRS